MTTKRGKVLLGDSGITPSDTACVYCPHTLDDHNGGVPGGYMRCDQCQCGGFCDRASAWWLDDPTGCN